MMGFNVYIHVHSSWYVYYAKQIYNIYGSLPCEYMDHRYFISCFIPHTPTIDNVCDQVGVSLWKVLGVIACLYQLMPRCCFCSTPTKAVGSWLPPCNDAFVRPLLAAAGAEWRACDWLSCHCRSIHARVMCSAGDTLLHPWEVTRGKERIHARNNAATGILL